MYHECECGEEIYCEYYNEDDDEVKPPLEHAIRQKLIDLQDQLLNHYNNEIGFKLEDKDVIRYTAMVEVLKAMLN